MQATITESRLTLRDEKGRFILSINNPVPSRKFGAYWLINMAECNGIILTHEARTQIEDVYLSEPTTKKFNEYLNRVKVIRKVVFE